MKYSGKPKRVKFRYEDEGPDYFYAVVGLVALIVLVLLAIAFWG